MSDYADPFHGAIWDSNDADRLRDFLKHRTGKRFILRLRLNRPMLPVIPQERGDLNAVALTAKQIEGYEQCIAAIFDCLVTESKIEEKSLAYPNIDDDSGWPEELQTIHRAEALVPNEASKDLEAQTHKTEGK